MYKVIFVGCHPDDIELGCSGTIRCFALNNYVIICVVLTRGEHGGDPDLRVQETTNALQGLGVCEENIVIGNLPDTRIPYSVDTVQFLEQFYDDRVYAVFIPSCDETHQDHRNASLSCLTAFRNARRLLAYESPSTTASFSPSVFVDITGHTADKWRALRCHKSQLEQHRMYLDYRAMLRLAAFRGSQSKIKFAEAFDVVRYQVEPPLVRPELTDHDRKQCP